LKKALEVERLSLREICEETLERGFPCWGPWRICRNVGGVSLFIVAPLGNLEEGSTTRDFQRWLKGSLEVERLSLRELCEENLEGGLPCWGPWRIFRKVGGVCLFIGASLGNLEKGSTTRDFQRWLKGALEVEGHCGVSDCDSQASRMRRLWPTRGCRTIEKNNSLIATGSRTAHLYGIQVRHILNQRAQNIGHTYYNKVS
jgi:hypothetical protein